MKKKNSLNELRKLFTKAMFTKDAETTEGKVTAMEEFDEKVSELEKEDLVEDEEMTLEDIVKGLIERITALESKLMEKEETTDEDETANEEETTEEDLVEEEMDLVEDETDKEVEDKCTTDSLSTVFAKAKIILPTIKFKHQTTDSVDSTIVLKYKKQTLLKSGITVDGLKDNEINILFEKTYKEKKDKNNSFLQIKTSKTTTDSKPLSVRFDDFWSKTK